MERRLTVNCREKGKVVGTALKDNARIYGSHLLWYLKKKYIVCLVCFMGAMYSKSVCAYHTICLRNRIQKIVDSLQGRGHIITDLARYGNFKDYEHT